MQLSTLFSTFSCIACFSNSLWATPLPAEEAQLDSVEVLASNPRTAVLRLAERLRGQDLNLVIPPGAFAEMPRPKKGIHFVAGHGVIDEVSFRFGVSVEGVRAGRVLVRRSYVFSWRESILVPVPREVIRAGAKVAQEDVRLLRVPFASGVAGYVLTRKELEGMIARRTLRPGFPVLKSMLERPAVIKRGDGVTVQTTTGPMRVSMKGEALEEGALGERIRVLNPRSGRTLIGAIVASGLVEIRE